MINNTQIIYTWMLNKMNKTSFVVFGKRVQIFFFFNRKKSLQSLPHLLWSSAFLNIHKSIRVNSASDPNQPHFRLAHKNVPPKTLLEKNFFKIKTIWFKDYFSKFHPKMVLEISFNLTIKNLFNTRNDVHLTNVLKYSKCKH